jgi:hypothetical protein
MRVGGAPTRLAGDRLDAQLRKIPWKDDNLGFAAVDQVRSNANVTS